MSKLLAWVGATILGAIGWWAGEALEGMFTAFVLSMVGTGLGLYLGRRMAAHLGRRGAQWFRHRLRRIQGVHTRDW